MPKTKAILIPSWVKAIKRTRPVNETIYSFLPSMMNWRSVETIEEQLLAFTPRSAVRTQIRETIRHLKELTQREDNTHPLVSKISLSANIPHQLMVSVTYDVPRPVVEGVMVVRVDIDGDITGVERQYQMNYRKVK